MQNDPSHHLFRLERSHYKSFAAVHWSMRVEPATPGWLDERFHFQFRELLTHTCLREKIFCPVYCVMPDHLHVVWIGCNANSDQINAMKFFRLHLNRLLAGETLVANSSLEKPVRQWRLQHQAFDHVLREEERMRNAFASVCFYVLANPVRGNLVTHEIDWPFSGVLIPGYPDLHPMRENHWELFWKLYAKSREEG